MGCERPPLDHIHGIVACNQTIIWRKQKETPGVEKAPGVSSPQRKESGRSGRDDGELRFGVRPGHPRKAVTSISQAEALAHGLAHLHLLCGATVRVVELDGIAALQDAVEDAFPSLIAGRVVDSPRVEVRGDDHGLARFVAPVDNGVDLLHHVARVTLSTQVLDVICETYIVLAGLILSRYTVWRR